MALLKCEKLCIGYGSKIVRENLNFEVEKGDYFFIVGENGSGKSTLLKTILGFTKPISGSIEFSSEWDKKGIGYLPQTSEIQKTFPATVWEIVLSGCQNELGFFPFYKKSHVQKAKANLKKVGMIEYAKKSFKELSGGQQQRVLFARALCATKSVLILDEPTKGFDSEITEKMYKIVSELNKSGVTILTISHDLQAAKKYGNKILELKND